MSIKFDIFNFVKSFMNLFASWLAYNNEDWAWCPVRAGNDYDRF